MPNLTKPYIGHAVMDNPGVFYKDMENQLQKLIVEPFVPYESRYEDVPQPEQLPFLVVIDGRQNETHLQMMLRCKIVIALH